MQQQLRVKESYHPEAVVEALYHYLEKGSYKIEILEQRHINYSHGEWTDEGLSNYVVSKDMETDIWFTADDVVGEPILDRVYKIVFRVCLVHDSEGEPSTTNLELLRLQILSEEISKSIFDGIEHEKNCREWREAQTMDKVYRDLQDHGKYMAVSEHAHFEVIGGERVGIEKTFIVNILNPGEEEITEVYRRSDPKFDTEVKQLLEEWLERTK